MSKKGVTVRELFLDLKAQIKEGNGDKVILISSDDEGNSFHTLWQTTLSDTKEIESIKESSPFHDNNEPEDVVLLG